MSFADPKWLALLIVPLALAVRLFLAESRSPAVPVSIGMPLAVLPPSAAERARRVPDWCRVAALALVVLALAAPIRGYEQRLVRHGMDVVVLLDVSMSMEALDLAPDRLEAAKRFARALVDRHVGSRFGIVTFAGRNALRCPLTDDRDSLHATLDEIRTDVDLHGEGTALGAAIVNTVRRLGTGRGGARAIVLLTDGHSSSGDLDLDDAAQLASSAGVRIFAVATGTNSKALFPTEFGTVEVSLPLDEAALGRLSTGTGGELVRIGDPRGLAVVSTAIASAENASANADLRVTPVSATPWLAGGAVLATLTQILLQTFWLRRFP
ncbi:MAG: VWA domain-containing protein [Vicinamibacterales bacterium]